jgi:hypothetical protein
MVDGLDSLSTREIMHENLCLHVQSDEEEDSSAKKKRLEKSNP